MASITEQDVEKIISEVNAEFPNDPAMRQVHVARRIIARKAELAGLTLYEYLKKSENELVNATGREE